MSLPLKAFPQGRPVTSARAVRPRCLRACLGHRARHVRGPAPHPAAVRRSCRCRDHAAAPDCQAPEAAGGAPDAPQAEAPAPEEAAPEEAAPEEAAPQPKPKPKKPKAPPKPPGQPPRSYVVPATSYFSYPNLGKAERLAIRNRVLKTINSTWGGRRTSIGTPRPDNGTIRIATWSFDDWDVAHALVAARKRGVSVQIVAAKTRNSDPRRLALAAQAPRPEAVPTRLPAEPRHRQLRPCLPRSVPGPGRHPAREVLPVQGRRRRARPGDHLPVLDEPHLHGLPGPVEPGAGLPLPRRVRRLPEHLQAGEAGPTGGAALPREGARAGRRLLLPPPPGHGRARIPRCRS